MANSHRLNRQMLVESADGVFATRSGGWADRAYMALDARLYR